MFRIKREYNGHHGVSVFSVVCFFLAELFLNATWIVSFVYVAQSSFVHFSPLRWVCSLWNRKSFLSGRPVFATHVGLLIFAVNSLHMRAHNTNTFCYRHNSIWTCICVCVLCKWCWQCCLDGGEGWMWLQSVRHWHIRQNGNEIQHGANIVI